MWRFSNHLYTLLAVVGFVAGAGAQAQQPQPDAANAAAAPDPSAGKALPGWLENLKLSPQQTSQIQAIYRDFDAQLAETWRQCGDRYKATIQTEAFLLAAIEANFTETQRKQARDHRHNLTPPVAVAAAKKSAEAGSVKSAATSAEEAAALGVVLTAEQIAAAGKLQEKFQPRLQALGEEIRTLHNRLIALEMDRLEAIEKVLTEQQRKLLGELRQSPPSQTQ